MDRFTLIFSLLGALAWSVDAVDESVHPYFVNEMVFQSSTTTISTPTEETSTTTEESTTSDGTTTQEITTADGTTTQEITTSDGTTTATAGSGRIPNDPRSPSFINNIQTNTMGPGCGNFYGVEVAYSETLTAAYVSIYDKDGSWISRHGLGDLTTEDTVKRFAGIDHPTDDPRFGWAESMIFMFGTTVDGEDQVIELIGVGDVGVSDIDGVPVVSLPMNGSTLKLGEDSIYRVIQKNSGVTEGWTAGDFGWRNSVGGGGDCYWLKTNNDQVWSGDYVDGGGSAVTTSAPSGAKGSSIVSLFMATVASLIFI